MKKLLRLAVLALGFLLFAGSRSFAYHLQGGDIKYTRVGPNTYEFKCTVYTDCSAFSVGNAITLNLTAPGCNTGRQVALTKIHVAKTGDPYCRTIGNNCVPTGRPNHFESLYTGTTTFTAAEAACPNWIINAIDNTRAQVANLVNPQGQLYIEAYLNLAAGVNNSSAVMNPVAPTLEFVCVGQDTRISFKADDADCDSLSYELVAPLLAAGSAYAYAPFSAGPGYMVNPNPPAPFNTTTNPQLGYYPAGFPATYAATYPLSSFNANWNLINPSTGMPHQMVQVNPFFNLDPGTGMLAFRPMVYHAAPANSGDNRYAVSVKVNEWRKINGMVTKVGSSQREMIFIVEDCGSNTNPVVSGITANGQPIQPGSIVTVRPGAPLNIQVTTSDQPGDSLSLETDATTILAGSTFSQTNAISPVGTIAWVAPATNGTCGVRYFYVRVRDNACPLRGKNVYVIGVRVSNTGTATGLTEERKNDLRFYAYPNPFREAVNFRITSPGQEIVICNLLGQEMDRIILKGNEKEISWVNAPHFAAGTYVARLIAADRTVQTLKFTKLQ